jgi:hypothetical protein
MLLACDGEWRYSVGAASASRRVKAASTSWPPVRKNETNHRPAGCCNGVGMRVEQRHQRANIRIEWNGCGGLFMVCETGARERSIAVDLID